MTVHLTHPFIILTHPFSPFLSIPGRWVEEPMSWSMRPTTVPCTVVPSPPIIYIFPTQLYTVMLHFSIYSRPEGDLLESRNPLLPLRT